MHTGTYRHVAAATFMLIAGGCGAMNEAGGEATSEAQQAISGFRSYANPEIGIISAYDNVNSPYRCAATAIAPNVAITAKECLDGARFFFMIEEEPFLVRRFTVRATWPSPWADVNLALLWLWEPVPYFRAVKENGTVNSTAAIVAFGPNVCQYHGTYPERLEGYGVKRIGFFTTQPNGLILEPMLCPGDSGAPVIDWNDGQIFGVVALGPDFHPNGTWLAGTGQFAATNLRNTWQDIMFVLWVWQTTSNEGR